MKRSTKIGMIAAVAVLLVAGVAIAAWLVSGTGTGQAKAGSLDPLTVGPGTASADLYPGLEGDLFVEVTNPNDDLVVTGFSVATGDILSDKAGCAGTNLTVTPASGLTIPLPAGGPTPISFTEAVALASDAPNGCQDATFTIPVTVDASTP